MFRYLGLQVLGKDLDKEVFSACDVVYEIDY